MKQSSYLTIILIIALAGLAFSGYLSYYNIFLHACSSGFISCGGSQQVKIFGQPTCIYGFFMYLIITGTTIAALMRKNNRGLLKTIVGFSALGTAFAGFLVIYELGILKIKFNALPSCAVGLVIFGALLAFSIIALRKSAPLPVVMPPSQSPKV